MIANCSPIYEYCKSVPAEERSNIINTIIKMRSDNESFFPSDIVKWYKTNYLTDNNKFQESYEFLNNIIFDINKDKDFDPMLSIIYSEEFYLLDPLVINTLRNDGWKGSEYKDYIINCANPENKTNNALQ